MAEIRLLPDEKVLWQYEADCFFVSSHPMIKAMVKLSVVLGLLVGIRKKGIVIATNKRLIHNSQGFFLWVFENESQTNNIFLDKISGFTQRHKASFLVFFKSKIMQVRASGVANMEFVFKKITHPELEFRINEISQIALGGDPITVPKQEGMTESPQQTESPQPLKAAA